MTHVVTTALRLVGSVASLGLSYLYVGGHVQNDTLIGESLEALGSGLGAIGSFAGDEVDPRAGLACVGEACHPECLWWSPPIGNATTTYCEPWFIRRGLTGDGVRQALEVAMRCAQRSHEACVLSHEVGYTLPAAFVWDSSKAQMRSFVLPRLYALDNATQRRVALFAPGTRSQTGAHHGISWWDQVGASTILLMNETLDIEYFDVHEKTHRREAIEHEAAFCVQLLRQTLPDDCLDAVAPGVDAPDDRF